MKKYKDYSKLNEFTYRLRDKRTGIFSRDTTWCHGNIYEQIQKYRNDMSKMCLLGVTNETHEIVEVIHNFDGKTIYENY